jgi:O-antigen biosynthesis protein
MGSQRVAIVFDNTVRPETTGTYCLRALQGLVEVEHFLPSDLERAPRGLDLYLRIDDGLACSWPADLHPCAWWMIDTHLDLDWYVGQAPAFDHVFVAQRDGAEALRQAGARRACWLPLACDPEAHRKHDVEKQHDVCFIGNLFPGPRQELVDLLRRHFPSALVGRLYFEEMARAYSASRVVFNRSIRNDVNMRVFEAVACGSLLLTNDLRGNGQELLFQDGKHLATYSDVEELLDKARFYLKHAEARERIAAAGRAHALAEHTYRQRMEKLLAEVERAPSAPVPVSPAPAATPRPSVPESKEATSSAPSPGYYEFERPELVALVPLSARHVLDVGCGTGRLGLALKARQAVEVVGLEAVEAAARPARERLDEVFAGDVEKLELPFAAGSFDAIVCGDVLEHLREPGQFLRRAREWLRPGGALVASIPNVRHHSVVRMLLGGDWSYEQAGLLDRTHLRFFTRRAIGQLLQASGFALSHLSIVPGPGHEEWQRQGRPKEAMIGGLHVRGPSSEDTEEFFVYQYLVVAVSSTIPVAQGKGGPLREAA